MRAACAVLAFLLAGCGRPGPVPDVCDMPPGLSWVHAHVRWSGVMIGGDEHGYVLGCDRHLRGLRLDWDEGTRGREALEPLLGRPGLLRVTIEGQLRDGETGIYLFATAFDRPRLQPMTEKEEFDWFDKLERAPR
ncbi:MAG: hypothetical protein QOE79_1267 [Sphingomonadales bacterium]|nr:hypothetical protein [Sphingomonadales bacterium]MEA3050543.1 hypothetical protein [Sphingomonadales bacterium]